MNPLDAIILMVIIISMGAGFRRGFIVGVYDMVIAVVSLLFAAAFYDVAGSWIGNILDLDRPALNLIGFVAAFTVIALPGTVLLRPAIRKFRSITGIVPGIHPLDRALGVIPGAIQGIVVAFVLVLASGFFSVSSKPGGWLSDSDIGLRMYRSGTVRVLDVAGQAGFEPSEFFALTRQAQGGSHVLPFQEDRANLSASVSDEARMLELVNQERIAAGLQVLEADPRLAATGRKHGVEMFELGYFSHESPVTGSPFDRLHEEGIEYGLAGENLAFAPDVEEAHTGLMNSPGHRANILEPGYRKVGIAAIESDDHGTMYIQMFTN